MNITDEETGDIFVQQGDDFHLRVKNIEAETSVFFAVSDLANNIIFEIEAIHENGDAFIEVDNEHSDLLTVPRGRKQEVYKYGIKVCKKVNDKWVDDTMVVGNKNTGEPNKITVYPKLSEGAKND
jgi:hypothetical protein